MHGLLMERGEIIDRLIAVKKHAGIRLGVPARARGRHDAPAGAAPPRHPAARHRREHLARHHRDLHLCAGAVLRCMPTCRRATPLMRDSARFHFGFTVPFVPHIGAAGVVAAVVGIQGRSRPGAGLRRRRSRRVVDRARIRRARRRSSRGCRSSTAPTIRRRCRVRASRAPPPTPW